MLPKIEGAIFSDLKEKKVDEEMRLDLRLASLRELD